MNYQELSLKDKILMTGLRVSISNKSNIFFSPFITNNFILDFHITSGNIHDSVDFSDLYQKIKNNSKQHTTAIAIDAGYITPYICKTILDDGIIPAIPYKRHMTKKGFLRNMNMYMMSIMIVIFVLIIRF